MNEKKPSMYCGECGKKIKLPLGAGTIAVATPASLSVEQNRQVAKGRTDFETALVPLKALLRDSYPGSKAPTCFISYAWGIDEDEKWVIKLSADLQNAGVQVILDRKDNVAIGSNVARFISRIEDSTFVTPVGTPAYMQKYENRISASGNILAAEVDLINRRLTGTEEAKRTVLPILLSGDENKSFPPLMRGKVYADFRDTDLYFGVLFDLILTLYQLPFDDPAVRSLRQMLSTEF